MNKEKFNKIFNIIILTGMTAVMAATTIIKLQQSDANSAMLIVAAFGSLMGVLANVCSANARILTFLFGFFDVSIYGVMCYLSGAYGNAALHLLYFVPMQFVGFFQWRKRGSSSHKANLRARRLSLSRRCLYLAAFLGGLAAVYAVLNYFDTDQAPAMIAFLKTAVITDAFATVCNILGQLLMSTAYMEQWVFWIGVNISSIILWSVKCANGEAADFGVIYIIKYSFYLLNSLNGLRIWLSLSKAEPRGDLRK